MAAYLFVGVGQVTPYGLKVARGAWYRCRTKASHLRQGCRVGNSDVGKERHRCRHIVRRRVPEVEGKGELRTERMVAEGR